MVWWRNNGEWWMYRYWIHIVQASGINIKMLMFNYQCTIIRHRTCMYEDRHMTMDVQPSITKLRYMETGTDWKDFRSVMATHADAFFLHHQYNKDPYSSCRLFMHHKDGISPVNWIPQCRILKDVQAPFISSDCTIIIHSWFQFHRRVSGVLSARNRIRKINSIYLNDKWRTLKEENLWRKSSR